MSLLSLDKTRARLFARIRDGLVCRADARLTPPRQVKLNRQCVEVFDELVGDWGRRCRRVDELSSKADLLAEQLSDLRARHDRLVAALALIAAAPAFFSESQAMAALATQALASAATGREGGAP